MVSDIVFRDATSADAEAVASVVGAAFGWPAGSDRGRHLAASLATPGWTWRVAEQGGGLIAALRVTHSPLRVGEGYIVKADVGEVAVAPACQGRGVGTALMQNTVRWLQTQDCDFTRLGGLVRFYARFGYVPFTRRYVEFYLRPGVGAGAATARAAYLEEPALSSVVTPATEADRQRCRELDLACNGWRVGALADSSGATPGANALVYREGDRVLAWLQMSEFPIDRTEFESRLTISGGAWEPGRPEALAALVAQVLRQAHERGHERVSARLPFDPSLFAALTAAQLPYKAVELHEAAAATMVRVLNLRSLFAHLLPELRRRWRQADLPLDANVGIETAGQTVALSLAPGRLTLVDEPAALRVSLPQPAFLAMALGLHAPACQIASLAPGTPPRLAFLLDVLFPQQLTVSGTWG